MITLTVTHLTGFFAKSRGLLGRPAPIPVFFRTRFGIHTFGMHVPIDILILDNKGRIRRMRRNLPPNTVFIWPPLFSRVVELPAGDIERLGLSAGTQIRIRISAVE